MSNYYKEHYEEYIDKTINIDLSNQYAIFEKYLLKGASILDVGFGSARDMLYFKEKGYKVSGIDLEEGFVNQALELGLDVKLANSITYKSDKRFDGIWCCASLVHMTLEDIKRAINNLKSLLTSNGVLYVSLKYGDFEGFIGERYFTYINEEKLQALNLNIIEKAVTIGVNDKNTKWLNLIIK